MSANKDKKDKVLSIRDLNISFETASGRVKAIRGVRMDLFKGETIAIVGESGSGKSVTVRAIMGILAGNGRIDSGRIEYSFTNEKGERETVDMTTLSQKEIRFRFSGKHIAMIFQDPMTSLDPTMQIGKQIMEGMIIHEGISKEEAKKRAIDLLAEVGIENPEKRFKEYPHQLSGGMRQRVMIAIAFACDPKILICDEPTTALDVTIQGQILDIIKNLQKKNQTSVIMITHDLGVVANIAQKIAVMYSGIIVESGTCEDIFYRPRHPYTWALIRSVPRLDLKNKQELATIPGTPPDLLNPPVGCPFCTRCSYCMPICKEEMPEVTEFGGEHKAACWLHHPMAPKVEMPNLEGGEL